MGGICNGFMGKQGHLGVALALGGLVAKATTPHAQMGGLTRPNARPRRPSGSKFQNFKCGSSPPNGGSHGQPWVQSAYSVPLGPTSPPPAKGDRVLGGAARGSGALGSHVVGQELFNNS